MTSPTIELNHDRLEPLVLGDCGGTIGLRRLDRGTPEARAVVDPATGRDGTVDRTQHFGARAVTAELLANGATWAEMQLLRAYVSPARTSLLTIRGLPGDAPDIQTLVRGAAVSQAFTISDLTAGLERIVAQWIAPSGIFEGATERVQVLKVAGEDAVPGRSYDRSGDRDYPSAAPGGSAQVTNLGGAVAYPLLRLFGPAVGPSIRNVDDLDPVTETAATLSFPDLTIAAGDYLEIDTRRRTIRLNGSVTASRYQFLDSANSRWWGILEGVQRLRYLAESGTSAVTQAEIRWRDAYL